MTDTIFVLGCHLNNRGLLVLLGKEGSSPRTLVVSRHGVKAQRRKEIVAGELLLAGIDVLVSERFVLLHRVIQIMLV